MLGYIETGKKEGARSSLAASRADIGTGKGYFLQPTVFADVTPAMTIAREEIFGPVLAVIDFEELDEAVDLANASSYGLAAAVWTRDIKKAHEAARRLQAGTVWVNTYNVYDTAAPFGGYKQSGFGRELGIHALEHYTQVNHHVRGQEGETIAPCWRLSRQPLQHLVPPFGGYAGIGRPQQIHRAPSASRTRAGIRPPRSSRCRATRGTASAGESLGSITGWFDDRGALPERAADRGEAKPGGQSSCEQRQLACPRRRPRPASLHAAPSPPRRRRYFADDRAGFENLRQDIRQGQLGRDGGRPSRVARSNRFDDEPSDGSVRRHPTAGRRPIARAWSDAAPAPRCSG